jgi:methylenetetrahydrofolate reductase (NADPH)
VQYIRANYGDFFCISVAGYPEGHPTVITKVEPGQALSDAERARLVTRKDGDYVCTDAAYAKEIAYLRQKVRHR